MADDEATPDQERTPVVRFVPIRCPACRRRPVRTYGQNGRIRYHECPRDGLRFKSIESDGDVATARGLGDDGH